MKKLIMKNQLVQIWKEAKTSADYIIALWITVLALTAGIGFLGLFYNLITNPLSFRI